MGDVDQLAALHLGMPRGGPGGKLCLVQGGVAFQGMLDGVEDEVQSEVHTYTQPKDVEERAQTPRVLVGTT